MFLIIRNSVGKCKQLGSYLSRAYSHNGSPQQTLEVLNSVLEQYEDVKLRSIRLTDCSFGSPFTASGVQFEEFCYTANDGVEEMPIIYFREVYQQAFDYLHGLVNGKLTLDSDKKINFVGATVALHDFLLSIDNHEKALRSTAYDPDVDILDNHEGNIAALLTNHLLSPLLPGLPYIISDEYTNKPKYCPCLNACMKEINYGRTKIGNEEMFYGVPDVILLPNSVMVLPEKYLQKKTKRKKLNQARNEENLDNTHQVEMHGERGFFSKSVTSQMISQTITFSLYASNLKNRKPYLANSDVTLIPSILLTPHHFAMYMYDYKDDVLLSSGQKPLKIWADDFHYNRSTILQIWMLLNHVKCRPCMHPRHLDVLKGSSNFKELCEQNGLNLADIERHILFKSQFNPNNTRKERREVPLVAFPANA